MDNQLKLSPEKFKIGVDSLIILSYVLIISGYFFLLKAKSGRLIFFLSGILTIYCYVLFSLVIDRLVKKGIHFTPITSLLNTLGRDISRLLMLVVVAIFSGHMHLVFVNIFVASVFIFHLLPSSEMLTKRGLIGFMQKLCNGRFSFFSSLILLVIVPTVFLVVVYLGLDLIMVSMIVSIFYALLATVWLIALIPSNVKEHLENKIQNKGEQHG